MAACQASREGGAGEEGGKEKNKTNLKAKCSWSAPRVERVVFSDGRGVCAL